MVILRIFEHFHDHGLVELKSAHHQSYGDIGNVPGIIDSTVVSPDKWQIKILQHRVHATFHRFGVTRAAHLVPILADLGISILWYEILVRLWKELGLYIAEHLLDIDPSL